MIFSDKFYVGYSDINHELKLSNTSMLKFFQDMACMHSASIGKGINDSQASWFLTAYHVKVHSRPNYEERVSVRTWSREMKGMFASREYEIYHENGELAVTALSNWVYMNMETMTPQRITPEVFDSYQSEGERTNFGSSWIAKLKECKDYKLEKDYYIDRNLIDSNNHMNNVFYLDLAELVLPEEIYQKGECDEFEIMYRKGILYGTTLKCFYQEEEDEITIAMKSQDEKELYAIVKLLYH